MEQSIVSSNPILFMIAVLLVFMACYTALDLLTTLITIVKYKRLLYIGSICSMGVAIWTLNFVVIFTFENTGMASYNFASIMLSLAIELLSQGRIISYFLQTTVTTNDFLQFYVYDGDFVELYNGHVCFKQLCAI